MKIGMGRFFETMVFMAGEKCVATGCSCGMVMPKNFIEQDFQGYMTAAEATKGHLKMCTRWATRRKK